MAGKGQAIGSVVRALDLLEALARSGESGLVELSRITRQRPSTTHRVLATLVERGYVRRGRDRNTYLLGYRVLELAAGAERGDARLRAAVRPHMRRVHRVCGETTNLIVLDGDDVVYVEQIASPKSMRMFAEPGRRVPAHATGGGKAILAFMPDAVERLRTRSAPLARFTTATITSPRRLVAELDRVRADGFAIDHEEFEEAVTCVAAPVFDHTSQVVAAMSVSGPTTRLGGPEDLDALGELIGRAAMEASAELGHQGPSVWSALDEPVGVGTGALSGG